MNYIECSSSSNKKLFFYVDNNNYLSNHIFIKNKLKVKYCSEISVNIKDYNIIFVKVPNKQEELFKDCMIDLDDRMVLQGFTEYKEVCKQVLDNFIANKKKVKKICTI